jgi:hypothetical protein
MARAGSMVSGIALVLAASTAIAQPPPPPYGPTRQAAPLPAPVAAKPPAHRDPALMIAGLVLTGLGAAGVTAGVVVLATSPHYGSGCILCGMDRAVGGLVAAGLGGLMILGGIPMAIIGGLPPEPGAPTASTSRALPTVSIGPGTGTLRWSF